MRNLLVFALVTLLFVNCRTTRNSPTPTSSPDANSLFWQISGKDLKKPSHIYGTIHMICPEDFRLRDTVSATLNNSGVVYMELDMDDPAMQVKAMQMMISKDKKLDQLLSKSDYALLSTFMKDSIGMPIQLFNGMKPLAVYSLITMKALPCNNAESYETRFVSIAKQKGIEVKGLESLADQIAVFDKIPDEKEAEMIMTIVREFSKQRQEFMKMVKTYQQENIQELYNEIRHSPDMKDFSDLLLKDRNKKWIPVMADAMKQGSVFFAVGAGHLGGPDGVLALLRKEGYTVLPVLP